MGEFGKIVNEVHSSVLDLLTLTCLHFFIVTAILFTLQPWIICLASANSERVVPDRKRQ